jgi:phenylacetate-CoA ligase
MRHYIILFYVLIIEKYRKLLMLTDTSIQFIFLPGLNRFRHFNSKARAYNEFIKAKHKVPAYRAFLKSKNFLRPSFTGFTPNISEIPIIDKENYVKIYPLESRCINGKIPDSGAVIDESSGSSGMPTNWVRGSKERSLNTKFIKFGMQKLFGKEPIFIINSFALGSWATGMNITMSCLSFAKVKSIGPDLEKIENTIEQFGKNHQYIIMGYPPFLKYLVDQTKFNFEEYNISFIFGGESMSEGMRDYLLAKGVKKVYSSYGASDLELNISSENDFTISLRKVLRDNKNLREMILKFNGALPMIFQYNPADFLIEESKHGELITTLCRADYIAPKIRYNIHDKGHILQYNELLQILKKLNLEGKIIKSKTDLPVLFHYGRADMTVSFFGSNISPTDIQEVIYSFTELAKISHSFALKTNEDSDGNKELIISIELTKNLKADNLSLNSFKAKFFKTLAEVNQDFKKGSEMANDENKTKLLFFEYNTGSFANNDIRIKAKYLN